MPTIIQLSVTNLFLKGREKYNKIDRFFSTVDSAKLAVSDGSYTPQENAENSINNLVLVKTKGFMTYVHSLNDFVLLSDLLATVNQANAYINFDGQNNYVSFDTLTADTSDLLDYSKNWTVGFTFTRVTQLHDDRYMCLMSNGGNGLYLRAGASNAGFYIANPNPGANTWIAPSAGDKVLITCDGSYIRYYLSGALRGTVPVGSVTNAPDGNFIIGAFKSGNNFVSHLDAGVDNFIFSKLVFGELFKSEYFEAGNNIQDSSYYSDLTSYCKLGEDTYPRVLDVKGKLVNGEFRNGNASDFVPIEND